MQRERIEIREPFDADALFGFLAARAIAGVEVAEREDGGWRYARTVTLPSGPGMIELTSGAGIYATVHTCGDDDAALDICRHILDADADPLEIDEVVGQGPLAPYVAAAPGLRVPGAASLGEIVVRAMAGQQISVAAAANALGKIAAAHGTPVDKFGDGLNRVFPTSAQLAAVDGETLPMPRARGRAIVAAAAALANGGIRTDSTAQARIDLLALKGIGPWSADYILMRALHDRDIFLGTDLVVRRTATALLPGGGAAQDDEARQWAPYRSYATMHLWYASAAIAATSAT